MPHEYKDGIASMLQVDWRELASQTFLMQEQGMPSNKDIGGGGEGREPDRGWQ